MKISCNWLRAHVDLELPLGELQAQLLRLGFEVAGAQRLGPAFSGVVVAKVLARDKHPNADKLSVCVVDDGAQKWNVVCGAPNVGAGQTIAFARIGAVLPGDFKIGKAKLRGVESQGMICSRAELGLPKDGDGIWIMGEGPALGTDVGSLLGPADDVLDVEITANRPDCLSHRGLARELAASWGKSLKPVQFQLTQSLGGTFPISVEDAAACPYYSARLIEGVKIGPSPESLSRRLDATGQRPVNNVVDVTNFILHDLGQPLHAFDADTLCGGKIIVRRSTAGEKFLALDHKTYELPAGLLVIADAQKVVALAGVMGGAESAVTATTTRVVLESATFAPSDVRRSSKITRLRSDSSYRFERGVDPAGAEFASSRAAAMILDCAGGQSAQPAVAATPPSERPLIRASVSRLNEILGASFAESDAARVLNSIAASFRLDCGAIEFRAPSWRSDLATPWDLAEEIGRFLGYDQIPYRLSPLTPRAATLTPVETASRKVRSRLSSLGLDEAYNYDLLSEKALAAARLSCEGLPRVANPLSEDWAVLRSSLIPGLLKNAAHNLSRGSDAVRFFEIGKVYALQDGGVAERWRVAGILLGPMLEARWQGARAARAGFADAKAVVEDLLAGFGPILWDKAEDPYLHPVNGLRASIDGRPVASVGWLHPRVARAHDLEREGAVVFDADLDWLAARPAKTAKFKDFSTLPVSRRDLALILDKSVVYAAVEKSIAALKISELQDLLLFDIYEGKGIADGKKSLAVRLTFGRSDRTLTDAEVADFVAKIVAALSAELGAVLRG